MKFQMKFVLLLIAVFAAWIGYINWLLLHGPYIVACVILDLLAALIIAILWRESK